MKHGKHACRLFCSFVAATLPAWAPAKAPAATTTTTFAVTLTITASCSVSATALGFGSAGILSANVDATSTVTVTCTNTTPYTVGLDAGTGTGATVAARKMTSGGATVTYSLYSDSGRTTVWGTTIGTNTVAGTGNGSGQALTVYGRVPSQTTPAPAAYSDTITVTVTY
jgi:spore coat protein U-like protein